ncbi:MAG TPA: SGNH/GDSL hydrolase family protein, partial [Dehalococcoidia bacterium]
PLAALLFLSFAPLAVPGTASAKEAPAYLALGDSFAFGVGATNPAAEGYVALTAAALGHGLFADDGLELVNLSEPDATSADLVALDGQLERALAEIATRQADDESSGAVPVISIDVGSSDLSALSRPDSPCFEDTTGRLCRNALNTMLGDLQTNLTRVLRELHEAAPEATVYVVDVFHPYAEAGEPLEAITAIGVQQVNGVIAAASADESLGARFVTVHELFQANGERWVAPDGIYPNNDGHRVLSEALIAAIEGRDIALPTDLAQGTDPAPTENGASTENGVGDDDVGLAWLLVIVPVAFAGGAFVSAVYFVRRRRR